MSVVDSQPKTLTINQFMFHMHALNENDENNMNDDNNDEVT